MKILLLFIIFLIVLLSLLASPAPVTIELSDYILIFLSAVLGVFSIAMTKMYNVNKTEYELLYAVIFYLSYLLISGLNGILNGVPVLAVLRSIGPYVSFFPLIFIGLLPIQMIKPKSIALILIVVGLLQLAYLFYLYYGHPSQSQSTFDILVNRITFLDQRTTLPLLLSVAILPIVTLIRSKSIVFNVLSTALILVALLGGMLTLTRSIILSMMVGWLIFLIAYLYFNYRVYNYLFLKTFRKIVIYLVFFIAIFVIISFIPDIHRLETGLVARFHDHALSPDADFTNGRLYDEWLPSLMTWFTAGWSSMIFGIGAGHPFTVLNGEERTYIHNLCIYSLVYGGFYGLFASLWLYWVVFKALITRALESRDAIYIVFSTLLASMFFYAQFFAIHKGLAFNVMLFLMIALALSQPKRFGSQVSGVQNECVE